MSRMKDVNSLMGHFFGVNDIVECELNKHIKIDENIKKNYTKKI